MRRKCEVILFVCCTVIFLTGCRKKFWEYDCIWYSESPYVYLETQGHNAVIEINGIMTEAETAWENNGTGITFYEKSGTTDATIIWETEVEIESGIMYLSIIEDNASDMEGEVIVLEQNQDVYLETHMFRTKSVLDKTDPRKYH